MTLLRALRYGGQVRRRRSGEEDGGQTRQGRAICVVMLVSVFASGCARGCTSSRPPIHVNPSMDDQPKVRPQAASTFFRDGAGMREPVAGTVAIGGLKENEPFFTGKGADGQFVATSPVAADERVVARGLERYRIYCQPCHDARGEGRGILFQRGNVPTASFHQEKVLKYPDGQIFDVITNGQGLMGPYKWPIPPDDRWAIVAYLRQLQRERAARAPAAPASAEASDSAKAASDKTADKPAGTPTEKKQ